MSATRDESSTTETYPLRMEASRIVVPRSEDAQESSGHAESYDDGLAILFCPARLDCNLPSLSAIDDRGYRLVSGKADVGHLCGFNRLWELFHHCGRIGLARVAEASRSPPQVAFHH